MAGFRKRTIVTVSVLAAAALAAGLPLALRGRTGHAAPERKAAATPAAQPAAKTEARPAPSLRFASAASYEALVKEDLAVRPAVPNYTLKPDLSNVANRRVFKPVLDPKLISMIARNGFAVTPTDYIQMFEVYENNEYKRPEKFPAFITTDSMLHTYHIFYDYTLRSVESSKLFDAAVKLTHAMLEASEADLAAAKTEKLTDAARRNVAYFAVARKLLLGTPPPDEVKAMAEADLAKIQAHQERDVSATLGHKVDFSQFVPRGHYTRSEKLKKYFRAMMWYGLTQFPIPQGEIGKRPTLQALLIVSALRRTVYNGEPALKLWDTIYEPTVFYVGSADDYTVYQYASIADRVYGKNPSISDFDDEAKLDRFIREVGKLPEPRIEIYTVDPLFPVGRQFRAMGQRFIPDSRIMQEMCMPKVSRRACPRGLDVLAAIGSDRALQILHEVYEEGRKPGYDQQMAKMRQEMRDTSPETWRSNLYYGWMWTLQSLTKPAPQGCPPFMRGTAWLDKCLFSALGSWTELRHDTILCAGEGGGGGDGETPTPRGYVEPNLEFWTKLKWLNEYTRDGLASRSLLDGDLKDKFARLGDWIDFCRRITAKELTNRKVTEDEYEPMETYGEDMEALILDFAGGAVLSETDKDMAVVADVHTFFGAVLEEGTGRAGAI